MPFAKARASRMLTRFGSQLAIDLGTANTCVFAAGHGVVLNEPSLIAFNALSGSVEAVGHDALEMLGRSPGYLNPVRPIRDGVIADVDAAEKMLAHFVKATYRRVRSWARPRVMIGVPTGSTPVERRAVKASASSVKLGDVYLIDEPIAAAVGAGIPIPEPSGHMIVDIGGGTTEVAITSSYGVVTGRSVRVAGNAIDDAIAQYLKRQRGVLVGARTAEQIKIRIGSALPLERPESMEVKGRQVGRGGPIQITVCDAEIREAIAEPLALILRGIRGTLERTPPELSADLCDRGIVLCGGTSLLRRLDRRIQQETQLPVRIAADPLEAVVVGAGRILGDAALLAQLATSSDSSAQGTIVARAISPA
jgi:rod shape-determining protein MreB